MLFSSAYSSSSSLPRLLRGPIYFSTKKYGGDSPGLLLPVLGPSSQAPKHGNQRKAIGCAQYDVRGRMASAVNNGGRLLFECFPCCGAMGSDYCRA